MKKSNEITEKVEKGAYPYHQHGAFVNVKNFIFTTRSGKRCLLLQFTNESAINVEAIKFVLVQLDSTGKVISKNTYSYGVNIAPAKDYALESGLIIKDGCADFRIRMVYAISGEYKYVFRNGESVQLYDPRGYSTKKYASREAEMTVKSRLVKVRRLHRWIAFISLAAVIAACAYAATGYFL